MKRERKDETGLDGKPARVRTGSSIGELLESLREKVKRRSGEGCEDGDTEVELMSRTLSDIKNVEMDRGVLQEIIANHHTSNTFEGYLSRLEEIADKRNCQKVVRSFKLFLNILFDMFSVECEQREGEGRDADVSPGTLSLLLDIQLNSNIITLINKLESLYNSERNGSDGEARLYKDVLFDYFNLLESVIELDPKRSSTELLRLSRLFNWLVDSLKSNESVLSDTSQNKIEILSILFQNATPESILELNKASINVMDLLLVKLANIGLVGEEITGSGNKEFVYNLIDIMCSLLLCESQRVNFSELEGIELMLKFIREKAFLRPLAVKVLSFALLSNAEVNSKFVRL